MTRQRLALLFLLCVLLLSVLPCSRAAAQEIERLPTSTAAFVGRAERGKLYAPVLLTSFAEFERVFGSPLPVSEKHAFLAYSVRAFFENGGTRCHVVRVADPTKDHAEGLEALRSVDEVSILCLPGVTLPAVQAAMIAHCEALGDRIALLDPDPEADPAAVRAQRERLRSDGGFAALYYPWVRPPAAAAGLALPPSGFVAGVCARTDREQGVWRAPTGEVLGAADVSRRLSTAEQDSLMGAGISVLRWIADRGVLVWGARTVSSDREWKYVNVRRFFLFLEESIHDGTEWAVFEPNDEPLWARLRASVADFLLGLWREGALQGAAPDEAFFVRADRTTMTQDDLDQGRTVIVVGTAPIRPAEFVVLRVVQDRSRGPRFLRGDSNADGALDISDAVRTLEFLFLGAAAPPCLDGADAADEGQLTLSAAVYVLGFLFQGGRAPPAPYPGCGEDPTEDGQGCEAPGACG
ncbi:MAG: phage tail sheath family protein [Planctomycetes bacterium]|nr:phage tail sheath family protein [Planctomycetota bacterium]